MNDEKFTYKYTAVTKEERREIEEIRQRYEPKSGEKDSLTRLKELDAKVKNPPMVWGLTLGVVGVLIFGLGLTMILEWTIPVGGIVCMLAGCLVMAIAYPVYEWLLRRGKKRYGEEILRLSETLLHEEETKY